MAFTVEKYADLTARLVRELGHLPGKFLRYDLVGWDATRGKSLDAPYLIVLQPLCKAGNAADKIETSET